MTDDRIEKMMLASLAEVREPRLWDSLTYESGPYSINKLKVDALKLGRVFARAVLAEQAGTVRVPMDELKALKEKAWMYDELCK